MSSHRTARLAQILRTANDRHCHLARLARATRRPGFRARRHADALGLRIDLVKATACPHNRISTKPYPIIVDQAETPTAGPNTHISPATSRVVYPRQTGDPTAAELLSVELAAADTTGIESNHPRVKINTVEEYGGHPAENDSQYSALDSLSGINAGGDVKTKKGFSHAYATKTQMVATTMTSLEIERTVAPLTIRIKRKLSDLGGQEFYVEKRPKYGRKRWIKVIEHDVAVYPRNAS